MNFKILVALIVLPLSVMAQNRTNEFDNVLINRGMTFKGGTPGVNKFLMSDAAGNYTPQTITAAGLPSNIVTNNGPNTFTSASFNTFNGPSLFVGAITNTSNNSIIGSTSGLQINYNTGKSTWLGVNSFEFDARRIRDSSDRITVDAENTTLRYPATSSTALQWANGTWQGSNNIPFSININTGTINGGTWSNTGTAFFIASNLNMNTTSRIAGMLNTDILTNITSSTLTVTGQGTHTINVEGSAGTGASALTNVSNFFISSSTNVYNGGIITSNLTMTGGMTVNRKVVTVNYTNTANDYYIAWLGTTSAQPTNFLATGFGNGKTYLIKDAQRSASTTNIIIKPLSSDTIMGASSYFININGQSITITYDGTSNWEIN